MPYLVADQCYGNTVRLAYVPNKKGNVGKDWLFSRLQMEISGFICCPVPEKTDRNAPWPRQTPCIGAYQPVLQVRQALD